METDSCSQALVLMGNFNYLISAGGDQQYALTAMRASHTLRYVKHSMASWSKVVILPVYLALVKPHLDVMCSSEFHNITRMLKFLKASREGHQSYDRAGGTAVKRD